MGTEVGTGVEPLAGGEEVKGGRDEELESTWSLIAVVEG